MAEAARCLNCGICSECLVCVQACPAGAIDHQKRAQVSELRFDAVIWADGMPGLDVRESVMGHPGVVVTELHTVTGTVPDYEAFLEHSKTTHPLGRVGQPDEIAALCAFLCSDEAGWITGGIHSIDGGRALLSAR